MTNQYRLIGVEYTKGSKSRKQIIRRLYCALGSCPLLERRQCIHRLFFSQCIYGKLTQEEGFTLRARRYVQWEATAREEVSRGPQMPGPANEHLEVVGDYVWLPYPHINHWSFRAKTGSGGRIIRPAVAKFVKFVNAIGTGGMPFIKLEDFTPETINALANARPRSLLGDEITSYQEKSVPTFLYDLATRMPELWAETVKQYPDIAEKFPASTEYASREVSLSHVAPGTRVSIKGKEALWDGEMLRMELSATNLFASGTWFQVESAQIELRPDPNTKVVVLDAEEAERLFRIGAYS